MRYLPFRFLHCSLTLVFVAFAAAAYGAEPIAASAGVSFAMDTGGGLSAASGATSAAPLATSASVSFVMDTGGGLSVGNAAPSLVAPAAVSSGADTASGAFTIARRGAEPDCAIVVATDAHETVQYAAKELQTFTKRMTGVELEVLSSEFGVKSSGGDGECPQILIVRKSSLSTSAPSASLRPCVKNSSPDSFRLSVTNGCLRIVGGGPRGVLYGVYDLLERFGGCEWFSSWVEEIPEREVFSVPGNLDFSDAPAFEERDVFWHGSGGAFGARCRFNGQFHKGQAYGGPDLHFAKGLGFQLAHTYGSLVSVRERFAKHPEWFSLVGGRRLGPGEEWQLCWSNKELQQLVVERCRQLLREDPGALAIGVSQNDCYGYCECAECAALTKAEGSPAGPNIAFANAVAEALEKDFPGVTVFTLAYMGTRRPPKTIRPRHNVAVVLSSFECAFFKPFETTEHPISAHFRDDVRKWGEICRNLYVWDYAVNFRNYLMPFANLRTFAPNYRFYRDSGVRWLFAQGSGDNPHSEFAELKCWLQSKLMWNPDQPIEPLVGRFLKAFYGNAAPLVGEYIDKLYAALDATDYRDPDPYAAPAWSGIYSENVPLTDDFLEQSVALWDRAEAAVADDPSRLYNVRVCSLPVRYTLLKRRYERGYRTVWIAGEPAPHIAKIEAMRAPAADFMARLGEVRKAGRGSIILSEGGGARTRMLLGTFAGLASWSPPTSVATKATLTTNDLEYVRYYNQWQFPIRLLAVDEGAKYRVRVCLRAKDADALKATGGNGIAVLPTGGHRAVSNEAFCAGIAVPSLHRAKAGTSRSAFPPDAVTGEWAWYDIGEYYISALQRLPMPTMNGLSIFVSETTRGTIEIGEIEIAKVEDEAKGGEFVVALRGAEPDCAIVVAGDAHETVQYAAKELQTFTKRMTGVELEVLSSEFGVKSSGGDGECPQILIARKSSLSTSASLRLCVKNTSPDSFRLTVTNGCLRIVGGGPRGVLYGVYELLERFGGCAWFSPWAEEIPEREAFAVPGNLDFSDAPAFEERDALWHGAGGAFGAHCRFNGQFHTGKACGGPALHFAKGLGFQLAHTYGRLVPPKEHFANHPEWFSLVGGRRLGPGTEWQLCWSNKELQQFVAERCKQFLREDPGAKAIGVSQNDWFNYCTCSNCAAITKAEGSPAGPNILFANAVAEEVEKEFPGVTVFALAYHGTRKPPKTIRPRHNVGVVLCTFECSFTVPFEKSDNENTSNFCRYLRDWGKICDNVYVWDYTVNFRNYLLPFPNLYSIGPNYRLFRDGGARWLFAQGSDDNPHSELAELKCWIESKLMWNPDQPVEPLIERFLDGFYGDAAPLVRQYIEDLYAAMNASPHVEPVSSDKPAAHGFYGIYGGSLPLSDDFLEKGVALWDRAEASVAGDPLRLYNVRVGSLSVRYTRLMRLHAKGFRKVWITDDIAPHVAKMEAMRAPAADFLARIGEVRKSGKGEIRLREGGAAYTKPMLDTFASLATWTPPTNAAASVTLAPGDLQRSGKKEWRLPLRLLAVDDGAKYRVRVRMRDTGLANVKIDGQWNAFWCGTMVPGNPSAAGFRREGFRPWKVKSEWQWFDIGDFDFSALQALPTAASLQLCVGVIRDDAVEFGGLEISKMR